MIGDSSNLQRGCSKPVRVSYRNTTVIADADRTASAETRMARATHGRAVHIAGRMVSLIVPLAGRERV
jgi:hypothetical protein